MTVLLAAKQGDKIVIGADSAATHSWQLQSPVNKIFKKSDFVFAGTGTCRDIQLVQECFTMPALPFSYDSPKLNEEQYIIKVANDIRKSLMPYGDSYKKEMSATFLVATRNKIFLISGDYSVLSDPEVLAAGAGGELALGAYMAMDDKEVADRVTSALEIACKYSIYCGGEVKTETYSAKEQL